MPRAYSIGVSAASFALPIEVIDEFPWLIPPIAQCALQHQERRWRPEYSRAIAIVAQKHPTANRGRELAEGRAARPHVSSARRFFHWRARAPVGLQ